MIMMGIFAKVCEALLDAGADAAAQSGEECSVLHYLVQVPFHKHLLDY